MPWSPHGPRSLFLSSLLVLSLSPSPDIHSLHSPALCCWPDLGVFASTFKILWQFGIALFLYFSPWAKLTINCSLSLSCKLGRSRFRGKNLAISSVLRHRLANDRALLSRLWNKVGNPVISQADG